MGSRRPLDSDDTEQADLRGGVRRGSQSQDVRYAAYRYGGNGITFSFLAACLIGDLIAGKTSPLLGDFAIDRNGGKIG